MMATRAAIAAGLPRVVERRLSPAFLALLLAATGTACGPPTLAHTDGNPLVLGVEPIAIEGGWIGFDECKKGIHAVVELEMRSEQGEGRPADLERLLLTVGREEIGWPTSVSVGGPFCPANVQRRRDPADRAPAENEEDLYWEAEGLGRQCTYSVRAQFQLTEIPPPGELVQLVHGPRTIRLIRREKP